jgi:hypothetical protein
VHDREAELALGEVLGEALVRLVVRALEVEVVVTDLEVHADEVHERDVVDARVRRRARHEELDGEAEEPARLVVHHAHVRLLRRARERVAPEQVEALPAVQVQELGRHDLLEVLGPHDPLRAGRRRRARAREREQLLVREEVDVVSGVDRLRDAVDLVRNCGAASVGTGDARAGEGADQARRGGAASRPRCRR